MFAVTVVLSIDSEKMTDILSPTATKLWLSVGDVEETVGAVVSIVKELTERVLLELPELSVTIMVQSLYLPTLRVLKVTALSEADAEEVELLQLPP